MIYRPSHWQLKSIGLDQRRRHRWIVEVASIGVFIRMSSSFCSHSKWSRPSTTIELLLFFFFTFAQKGIDQVIGSYNSIGLDQRCRYR